MEKVLEKIEKKQKDDEALVNIDMNQVKEIGADLQEAIRTSIASRLDLSPSF